MNKALAESDCLKQELAKERHRKSVLCISRFYNFFQLFWPVISTDPLVINWHIPYLCDQLQIVGQRIINREPSAYDLIINIPPGMTKSTVVSQAFPVWLWLHDPRIITISSSYSEDLAVDHSRKSKDIVKSELFAELFQPYFQKKWGLPLILVKDNEKDWRNNFGGGRYATSTGGTVTGKHAHLIVRDDPINPQQAESEAYRIQCNRFNDRTLPSRKKDKKVTPTVTVMQRLHMDDTTGHDLAKAGKKIKHICLPAVSSEYITPEGLRDRYVNGLLDPHRLDEQTLADQKIDLGDYAYAGQYLQKPVIAEGLLYPSEELNWFSLEDLAGKTPDAIIGACDVADKGDDDFCAPFGWVFGDEVYITDIVFTRDPIEVTEARLAQMVIDTRCQALMIESNAGGRIFALDVGKILTALGNNTAIHPRANTQNKETRIIMKSVFVKKRFHFMRNPKRGTDYWRFLNNLTTYLRVGGNKHDDAPDGVTMLAEFFEFILPHLKKERTDSGAKKSYGFH